MTDVIIPIALLDEWGSCKWDRYKSFSWSTSCGKSVATFDVKLIESFESCPYCGKPIRDKEEDDG